MHADSNPRGLDHRSPAPERDATKPTDFIPSFAQFHGPVGPRTYQAVAVAPIPVISVSEAEQGNMQTGNITQFLVWGYSSIGVDDRAATETVDAVGTAPEEDADLVKGGDTRPTVGSPGARAV